MTNNETVKAMYEAFGKGDIPFIIDQLSDAVSWEDGAADHGIPWLTPGVGKAHVLEFFGRLADFDFQRFDVETVLGDGELVAGVVHAAATLKSTGGSFDTLETHLWRFGADGKVIAFNHLVDTIGQLAALQPRLQTVS